MDSPDKLNYDLPLLVTNISHWETERGIKIVSTRKLAIEWSSITAIEEYPMAFDDVIDWKEHKGVDRTWISHDNDNPIVLVKFEDILPYWEYYLKYVKVNMEQVHNNTRRR